MVNLRGCPGVDPPGLPPGAVGRGGGGGRGGLPISPTPMREPPGLSVSLMATSETPGEKHSLLGHSTNRFDFSDLFVLPVLSINLALTDSAKIRGEQ